jgi:hypothetical protein
MRSKEMSPAKTCLILGAGASKPYGYWLGSELKGKILRYCRRQPRDCAPEASLKPTWSQLEGFARRFEGDASETIDKFMEKLQGPGEREPREHGKMALAKVLGNCEVPRRPRGWYRKLANHLQAFSTENPLRIVTLNYDRSLEFFVSRHYEELTECSIPQSRKKFREVTEIRHLYGLLADLPDLGGGGEFEVKYGQMRAEGWNAWNARERMRFIGDPIDPKTVEECKRWIDEAEYVIALGFGYHKQNVQRLGLDTLRRGKCLFSSGFGLDPDKLGMCSLAGATIHLGSCDHDVLKYLRRTKVLESAARGLPAADLMEQLSKASSEAGAVLKG